MTRHARTHPTVLPLGVGLAVAVLLAYMLAHAGPALVFGAVLALPAAWLVVAHPRSALYLGVAGILTIPYWYTVGVQQAAVFRLACLVVLVACAVARPRRLVLSDWLLLAIVAGTVVSWLVQDAQPGVGKILLNELLPVAFYIAARTVDPDHQLRVLAVVAIAGALGGLTVIYEWHVGHLIFQNPSDYSWNASDTTIFRAGGIFGSPPGASTVLAVTALCGVPLFRAAHRWRRLAWTLCIAVSVLASFVTFTRASLIGLALGLVVYLWLVRSRLLSPLLLLTLAIVTTFFVVFAIPKVSQSASFQQSFIRPGNLVVRTSYWQLALPIVGSSPSRVLFGLGAETAEVARLNGVVPGGLASAPVLILHGTHNQYVLVLLEQGAVGLTLLVAWLVAAIAHGARAARRTVSPTAAALTGAVVAIAAIMLANNALLHPPSFALLALAAGLLANHGVRAAR
jgi:O-antigen ligase